MDSSLKFNETEFTSDKTVSGLPDVPSAAGMTATQLKARFDNIGKVMIALGKHNALVDALSGVNGASGIGTLDYDEHGNIITVQGALDTLYTSATSADARLDALEALGLSVVNNQICITY